MKKIVLLLVCGLVGWLVGQAYAAELTDAKAGEIAKNMLVTIERAKTHAEILKVSDTADFYKFVQKPLLSMIKSWPEDHLDNRAIFPYSECRQAAVDLIQVGKTRVGIDRSANWKKYIAKRFNESYQGCRKSIKNPDLSSKDVQ